MLTIRGDRSGLTSSRARRSVVLPECTSVTYSITKSDDAVLTSAASGVVRLVIGLTRQSVSDLCFYFPGLEGVAYRAAPWMVMAPSYLPGSWSEHWLDLLGPH